MKSQGEFEVLPVETLIRGELSRVVLPLCYVQSRRRGLLCGILHVIRPTSPPGGRFRHVSVVTSESRRVWLLDRCRADEDDDH